VSHDLVVEYGVKDFGYDWEKGDRSVVFGECFVLLFVEFDEFGDLE